MFDNKSLTILTELRKNARESLTNMSKRTNIPVSTIFERIRNSDGIIKKHTAILDFNRLGFSTITNVLVKVKKNSKDELREFLIKSENVNSVYKISNGYDYLFEGVFRNMIDMENFLEKLEERFGISARQVFFQIEDLKRESFMSDPMLLQNIRGIE